MLAHKAPCLGAEFHNRERRGVVDKERQALKFLYAVEELVPFELGEVAALDFFATDFAHVGYKTVYELQLAHFEREYRDGVVVEGYVERHRQHEGRLAHRRTRRDNDEVGVLPARRVFVEFAEAAAESAQTRLAFRCELHLVDGLGDNGVDLGYIFFHVALR